MIERFTNTEQLQALFTIAEECVSAADDIVSRLDKLRPPGNGMPWTTIRHAIISVWSKEELNELLSRLDTYRSELAFGTLLALNEKIRGQAQSQEDYSKRQEHHADDIIEAIAISSNRNAHEAAEYHQKTQNQLQEVIAAILTHKDGQTTTISQPISRPLPLVSADEADARRCITLHGGKLSRTSSRRATTSLGDFGAIQLTVLETLVFGKIRDRVDEVAPACQNTFNWVVKPPKPTQRPWSDFSKWIRTDQDQGCYWINGKAGSGKSTLMKHISNSKTVAEGLSEWAGKTRLVVASYFSWNLGATLQKSEAGLLRSLLHDILGQVPDLIPAVLPKLFRAASMQMTEVPSITELRNGIINLAKQSSIPLRICFFIDGIDEFDTDHAGITQLFSSISSPHIKVVLSSRPLPVCYDVFGNCPGLRLQDLTIDDIRSYTNQKVRAHKRWREMVEEEGQKAERLVDEIAEKAEGVFLWVVLAVASLLEGLRNYDRLGDFQKRLEILPPDLEDLYSHMLNKMQPLYLQQASQLLQIVLGHAQHEPDQHLSALQLSFATETDPDYYFKCDMLPMSLGLQSQRYKAMEGRLRSRCCGLVEIWQAWKLSDADRVTGSRVIFLHRTVVEFLSKPKVMNDLRLHAPCFSPSMALAKGLLIDVKTCPTRNSSSLTQTHAWKSMQRCLRLCSIVEQDEPQHSDCILPLLDELDRTMKFHWTASNEAAAATPTNTPKPLQKFDWSALELQRPCWLGNFSGFDLSQASLLILSATMGLRQYVHIKCLLSSGEEESAQLHQVMRAVVFSASRLVRPEYFSSKVERLPGKLGYDTSACLQNYILLLDDLLEAGVDPNHSFGIENYSPWTLALALFEDMHTGVEAANWCHMLDLMLRHGADPDASVKEYPKPAIKGERQYIVRYKTGLALVNRKISKLTDWQQRRRQPSPDEGVVRMLLDLKTQLLRHGATDRQWSELKARKTQRDATPAPWSATNPETLEPKKTNVQKRLDRAERAKLDGRKRPSSLVTINHNNLLWDSSSNEQEESRDGFDDEDDESPQRGRPDRSRAGPPQRDRLVVDADTTYDPQVPSQERGRSDEPAGGPRRSTITTTEITQSQMAAASHPAEKEKEKENPRPPKSSFSLSSLWSRLRKSGQRRAS